MLKTNYDPGRVVKQTTIDNKGREVNDPTRLFLASDGPETLQNQIRRLIRREMSEVASAHDMESWDEANDFDVKDDFEAEVPESKYTLLEEEHIAPRPKPRKKAQPVEKTEEPQKKEDPKGPLKSPLGDSDEYKVNPKARTE